MKMGRSKLFAVAAVLAVSVAALAQGPSPRRRRYDPKTEITVKGTVEDVQQYTGRHGMTGVHLILKTDSSTLDVHVGPSAYISQQHFSFAKGDSIEVVGSKITLRGTETLLAREITKDGKTLVLRDAQGIPQWAGGPRMMN
jgi:DNA/RNA endonuclease YhcR with UshA esterase domain